MHQSSTAIGGPAARRAPPRRLAAMPDLRVVELQTLAADWRERVIGSLAATYHQVWGAGTDNYATPELAAAELKARFHTAHRTATFVALTPDNEVAGTASIGGDDYYAGFSASNGVQPGAVGRDLYTRDAFRGVVMQGLKVWEHLLEARLRWLLERGQPQLTVYTEVGPIDLPALYGRVGAVVLRRGLHHRRLGPGTITMLGYPAGHSLNLLAQVRQRRLQAQGEATWPQSPRAHRADRTTARWRGLRLQGRTCHP